jgi:hypothetical protein
MKAKYLISPPSFPERASEKVNNSNFRFDSCIEAHVDIEGRSGIRRERNNVHGPKGMRNSLESRQYVASKAIAIKIEATDWWVGAGLGFAVFVTVIWNAAMAYVATLLGSPIAIGWGVTAAGSGTK